jgi:hypothetical protein
MMDMLAGGLGCAFANGSLNCLETTKVKLQLHNIDAPTYRTPTMAGVMLQIAREDGVVRGLVTPGLSASLARSMTYGGYRVGLYPAFRSWVSGDREPNLKDRMISGTLTGAIGSAISCPLDCVRTRMQADAGLVRDGVYTTGLRRGEPVRYRGMFHAFATILRQEGLARGLYRGSSVTVARASLLNCAQLASYDSLKVAIKRDFGWDEGPRLHFVMGIASGVIAQTVVPSKSRLSDC